MKQIFSATALCMVAIAFTLARAQGERSHTEMIVNSAILGSSPQATPTPTAFGPSSVPVPGLAMTAEPIVTGLTSPVTLTHAGDGSGRLFVADQIGKVRIIQNGSLLPTPFLDLTSKLIALNPSYDERGLLGLVFHPDYTSNRRFFVYYSAPPTTATVNCTNILAEYKRSLADSNIADPLSERILLMVDKPQSNHNGGMLAFGNDGYLYLSLGDGGGGGDQHGTIGNGQNLDTLLGKIIRIDVSPTTGTYAIPPDNPFVGIAGRDEIWAYGVRNPWKFSFDKLTGRLFCADVGQNTYEEVDIIEKGKNYGWRIMEGFHCYNPTFDCDPTGLELPIIEYDHTIGVATVGGYVYRGTRSPDLAGKYVFGDWSVPASGGNGRLMYLDETSTGTWRLYDFVTNGGPGSGIGAYVLGFGEDEQKELYVLSTSMAGPSGTTGAVHHIIVPLVKPGKSWSVK